MKYKKPDKNREEKIPFAPGIHEAVTVSYTHLTLPTKLAV